MKAHLLGAVAVLCLAAACGERAAPTETLERADRAASLSKSGSGTGGDGVNNVFEFDRLAGNARPYVGAGGAIRGVPAGGLPWVIGEAEAELSENGVLHVEVEGLVIDPDDARAISLGFAGRNPVPRFKAILSCESVKDGVREVVNVHTESVPATPDGDAEINEWIPVPDPCYGPIVLVTSPASPTNPTGSWFAATGW